jgi:hypothetical protein
MPAVREGVSQRKERSRIGIALRPGPSRRPEQMTRMILASGTFPITIRLACAPAPCRRIHCEGELMNGLIYLVGLIVVIMAILSLFGLR